jgi:acetaldehyde dehydrogenase (acetylating)
MEYDADLRSIQEARRLAQACREAQRQFAEFSQHAVDFIVSAMAEAGYSAAERLGRMAQEETGYGVAGHKALKNQFATRTVWESIRGVQTVGIVRRDPERKLIEIAEPVGVIAGLTPSTNPTSTVLYKALIAVKGRNGIVFAPHPSAVRCSVEAAQVVAEAAERAGAPKGLIASMETVSLAGAQELMRHYAVNVILATGGAGIVRAAQSAGKPAYAVGPGNVAVWVDRTADLRRAARTIVRSKAFDNSVICCTEQNVVADQPIARELAAEMEAEGAYFVDSQMAEGLSRLLFSPEGAINPRAVGKTPQVLAHMAGFVVPEDARILVARPEGVGPDHPLSRETLTTVLGYHEVNGWEAGSALCREILRFGGDGHTAVIHARDDVVVEQVALRLPAYRIVVNSAATLGGVGLTCGFMPAMTVGTGGIGGSITGDNITATHLINAKRIGYETSPWPEAADGQVRAKRESADAIDALVEAVLARLREGRGVSAHVTG